MPINRRQILAATSLSSLHVLLSCRTINGSELKAKEQELSGTKVKRQMWREGEDLAYQRDFIRCIQWLKDNDSKVAKTTEGFDPSKPETFLSYENLVAIHISSCSHGSRNLLPWHRLYVYYFEAACQWILNDPSFGVPYWDWTRFPYVPSDFLVPDSILFKGRKMNPQEGKPRPEFALEITGKDLIDKLLLIDEFDLFHGRIRLGGPLARGPNIFNGRFETGPHNNVHNQVGGSMADAMGSPEDPLFWLHHSNVDRIWAAWQKLHPEIKGYEREEDKQYLPNSFIKPQIEVGAENSPTYTWRTTKCLLHIGNSDKGLVFVDGKIPLLSKSEFTHGAENAMLNADLVDHEELGYTYDDLPIMKVQTSIKLVRIPLVRESKNYPVEAFRQFSNGIISTIQIETFGNVWRDFQKEIRARSFLSLGRIPFPKTDDLRQELILRVFAFSEDPRQQNLDLAGPHAFASAEYVGNYSFFVPAVHHAEKDLDAELGAEFDVTDQVRSAKGKTLFFVVIPYNLRTQKAEMDYFAKPSMTSEVSIRIPRLR